VEAAAGGGGRSLVIVPDEHVIVDVDRRTRMRHPDHRIRTAVVSLLVVLLAACRAPAPDRLHFATPDEAAKAVATALKTNDTSKLTEIFGPDAEKDLTSGDPVADRRDREVIALAMEESWRWDPQGTDRQELIIGEEGWPFPIPLTKAGNGWQFDTDAGREEMLSRRIGRDELNAIDLCRDYVLMQKEYASQPRDGKLAGHYAQRLRSTPGRQDGLYWPVGPEERTSPLGALMARAAAEGYDESKGESQPFWGYRFRVLTAQGNAAKGGAKSYIVNGEMTDGFGLIAYPAEYGHGGIMTFVVNQDGIVHEKDLGADTLNVAARMTAYDPDSSWAEVKTFGSGGTR
jgi:DUF2950 family protein